MDITTIYYLIFLGLFLILLFAIILFVHVRKASKNQHEVVISQQNKYLTQFWENLSSALESYEVSFNRSVSSIEKEMASMEVKQKTFIENQKKEFKELVSIIKVDYKEYLKEIKKLNDHFNALTADVATSIDNFDKVHPILEDNYKKLEVVSDKSKELISEHQKTLWEHNAKLDKTLSQLTEKMNDEVTELKAQTEVNIIAELKMAGEYINTMTEHADMIFKEVSGNTKKQIEEIASMGEKQLKKALDDSNFLKFNDKIAEFNKELNKVISDYKEASSNIESIKQSIDNLEESVKSGQGKRRLF